MNVAKLKKNVVRPSVAINRILIDLGALKHNLSCLERFVDKNVEFLLVVKANAYGHGMVEVAHAVREMKRVVYLGVSNVQEALTLRRGGVRSPILILGATHPDTWKNLLEQNVTFTISSIKEALTLNRLASQNHKKAKVHVELDTGMGRLGVWCEDAIQFMFKVETLPFIHLEGVYTHFTNAGEGESALSEDQMRIFNKALTIFKEMYPRSLRYVHMANSLGMTLHKDSHFNLVRPGIMAYGVIPCALPSASAAGPRSNILATSGVDMPQACRIGTARGPVAEAEGRALGLKPVMSLKSRVAMIKTVERGRTISYGRTYTARRRTRIATIPMGYSAGYPFQLSNRGSVLVRGRRCPIVGRVTMDHLMIDLGPEGVGREWDDAILIGRSGRNSITVNELASQSGTIAYDILCALSAELPREYIAVNRGQVP